MGSQDELVGFEALIQYLDGFSATHRKGALVDNKGTGAVIWPESV